MLSRRRVFFFRIRDYSHRFSPLPLLNSPRYTLQDFFYLKQLESAK